VHLCILLFLCFIQQPHNKNDIVNFNQNKFLYMGRGDKKTRRGKIFKGSFGKSRPSRPGEAAKKTAAKSIQKKES
jgi:30S ribosomal protein S31